SSSAIGRARPVRPRAAWRSRGPPRPEAAPSGRAARSPPITVPSASSRTPEPDMLVAIIDYGSGNLRSAAKALERAARESDINARIVVTGDPRDVRAADRIVLPGVGAFGDCRDGL